MGGAEERRGTESKAGRQKVAGVRILHIPTADEQPMQVYEVGSLNEAAEAVSIPGEGRVSVLADVSATDGHRLYWNDSTDDSLNARGTDLARAYGVIDARGWVSGDVAVVGPHPDLDVSNDAIREIVTGYEFDIDWNLYGERTPEGHPVDNARNYLTSIDNEKAGDTL